MAIARVRDQLRKQDTRHKIELGGLVMKAGLGEEESAVILGILLDGIRAMNGPNGVAIRERFKNSGVRSFTTGKNEHDDLI